MKRFAFFVTLALISEAAVAAQSARSVAEDVADVATRACYNIAIGRLRWNPADREEEAALLKRLGLTPGIPSGIIDSFGANTASTFNRSVLASRANSTSHILLAVGGAEPGCRVSVAGAPGAVTASDVTDALRHPRNGWTFVPELTVIRGPIERRSFLRKSTDGTPLLLDVLVPTNQGGTFRLMTMISRAAPGMKLPEGW